MRLLSLRLLAFGHFTDEELDLSRQGALHLVHGPNEAGKSTALRAITGLLFGIPERTNDAHLHSMTQLRVGARIASDGETFEVVRKKGRKNTLLDPDGRPLDDAPLRRALGGVSEALFKNMFGLDHRSLREGAKALLEGEGGLGESLFDAGGARGIGAVLAGLRSEADAIFKPRGKNQTLNLALSAYNDAKKAVTLKGTEPRSWAEQKKAYETADAEREAQLAERQRLAAERNRLDRALRVMPLLSKRRELLARKARLGPVPRLPEDASARHGEAEQQLRECGRDRQRLQGEIARLEQQRAAIAPPEALATLDEELIATLESWLGRHRNAAEDLPKRRDQLADLQSQLKQRLRELGRDIALDELESLRVDKPTLARIERLADRQGRLAADQQAAARALASKQSHAAALQARLDALPPEVDSGPLEAALARATRAGDVDRALDRASRLRQRLSKEVEQQLARLELSQPLDEALRMALPPRFWVSEQQTLWKAQADARVESARRLAQLDADAVRLDGAQAELGLAGDVPSQDELSAARQQRDQAWKKLRAELGAAEASDLDRFEELSVDADEVADRLRHEAERVERQARLHLDRDELRAERDRLEEQGREQQQDEDAARAAWQARCKASGIGPASPSEMLDWLDRYAELVRNAEALASAEVEEQSLEAAREELSAALTLVLTELEPAGQPGTQGGKKASKKPGRQKKQAVAVKTSLAAVIDAALPRVDDTRRQLADRQRLLDTLASARAELGAVEVEHQAAAVLVARWREDWAREMPKLGLGPDASVEEARAVLAALRDLFVDAAAAGELARRIEAMLRDAGEFEQLVGPLCEAHATDLSDRPVADAAAELLSRARKARDDLTAREALDGALAERRAELASVDARHEEASAVLADLFAIAGVGDSEALAAVARASEELGGIAQDLGDTEAALLAEGATVEVLEQLTADLNVDETRARLSQLAIEQEQVDEDLGSLDQQVGSLRRALEENYAQRQGAHEAAADQQACLATIRSLAERYAKLQLASSVLEREIERFREKNQGPIITRASQLFPRLSLGEYSQVRVSFDADDEPELRCIGVDGADVTVQGLSDGARDQLYLALRVASLERYAEQRELLPFVADDILVHFDEDRAAAALRVLAELAETTQVLMFSHHARHVELAREVVAAEQPVHQLAGRRRAAKAG